VKEPVGTCCVVLHTHLPWLAHGGRWPVGEEWFHQAWAGSYQPVVRVLEELAAEGRSDVLTLGLTPVLTAMLDDPHLLRELHEWLASWELRAWELAARPGGLAPLGEYEHRQASSALADFESRWRHGGSAVLRRLADSGVVELLGGPATHPYQPLVADERLVDFQLAVGLADAALRLGRRPAGIWAPECGYRPGLEQHYARAGVTHLVSDGPMLLRARPDDRGATAAAWTIGDCDVVVLGRDLEVTYRVWSPRAGYPGGRWYRDFHSFDHPTGFRAYRVTSRRTPAHEKAPYDPVRARVAVQADAADFVRVVVERLTALARERGRPGLVVVAYDTELFGHWWHEGPAWLAAVLRLLPEAGVRLTTLRGAVEAGAVEGRVDLPAGSWGSGKDDRVWAGAAVQDLLAESRDVQRDLLDLVDKHVRPGSGRDPVLDQLAREAFLGMASDWAFLVSKDSSADYARARHTAHVERFRSLARQLASGSSTGAARAAADLRHVDGPFGHLDARALARP
jgi:1,4-alpha-glucan branching enzyme